MRVLGGPCLVHYKTEAVIDLSSQRARLIERL